MLELLYGYFPFSASFIKSLLSMPICSTTSDAASDAKRTGKPYQSRIWGKVIQMRGLRKGYCMSLFAFVNYYRLSLSKASLVKLLANL
jgi:hypothetical protein